MQCECTDSDARTQATLVLLNSQSVVVSAIGGCAFANQQADIGADAMGAMGSSAPTAKDLRGRRTYFRPPPLHRRLKTSENKKTAKRTNTIARFQLKLQSRVPQLYLRRGEERWREKAEKEKGGMGLNTWQIFKRGNTSVATAPNFEVAINSYLARCFH